MHTHGALILHLLSSSSSLSMVFGGTLSITIGLLEASGLYEVMLFVQQEHALLDMHAQWSMPLGVVGAYMHACSGS
jgi:hypothetical protein